MLPENIFKPSLNWLLIFIPVALALERFVPDKSVPIFLSAALAIVPIASLIVKATEHLASHTGDAIGGLLNATFISLSASSLLNPRKNTTNGGSERHWPCWSSHRCWRPG
jgi:hypothetical protein